MKFPGESDESRMVREYDLAKVDESIDRIAELEDEIERLRALVPDTEWQNFWVFVKGDDGRPCEAIDGENGWENADTGELLQVAARRRPGTDGGRR